jgi:hypothetical protein
MHTDPRGRSVVPERRDDYYAITKSAANARVIEAGSQILASLRQTYIAISQGVDADGPDHVPSAAGPNIELIT